MKKIKGKTLIIVAIVSMLMLSVVGFLVWKKYFNNNLQPPTMYTVVYCNEDGSKISSVKVKKGKSSNFTFSPTKASDTYYDYTFEYWQDENGENVSSLLNNVNENMTVYPYFSSYQHSFLINFYDEDKTTLIESKLVARNSNVDIDNPTKASDTYYDYSFEYWSDNEGNDATSSMQNIQSNINLYAKFHISNQHTFLVNFYDDDGVTILQTYNVLKGNDLEVEDFVKEKDETYFYKFLNWESAQGNLVDDFTNIQRDMNLYAKYKFIQLNVISGGVTYSYNSTNDVYEVADFDDSVSSVILLGEIEDIEVTKVSDSAFKDSTVLEQIVFSDNITTIGNDAFNNCTALKSVNLTNNVAYIGVNAFEDCVGLEAINLPTKITVIKGLTFKNCSNLSYINIPDAVRKIELGAFAYCTSLSNVILPINLKTIEVEAFYHCTSLLNISFPDNLETIESYAFNECISLSSIFIPSNTDCEDDAFRACTGVKRVEFGEGTTSIDLYSHGPRYVETVVLPETTQEIKSSAFRGCSYLKYINLPNSINCIGEGAFSYCKSLTSIKIPDLVTKIEDSTFSDCTSLENINLNNVTAIGSWAFEDCASLDNINLSNVTTIGESAFSNCTSLESIELSDELETIGPNAFVGVKFDSVTIPTSVKSYSNVFDKSTLKNIILADGTTEIPASAFKDWSALTSITIPDSVTSIGKNAFKGTAIKSIRIPLGLITKFKYSSFNYIDSLETIIFPEGINTIPRSAFYEAESLPNIIFPSSIENIDSYAFRKCYDIKSLCFANEGPFCFDSTTGSLTLPDSITVLGEYVFYYCENLSGTISFPDALKSIGTGAFSCCNISNVNLNKLETLGSSVFTYNKLRSVVIPSSMTVLTNAFNCNEFLQSVSLPDELTKIEGYAFSSCTKLNSIKIPDLITEIADSTFYECTSLTTIEYKKITVIGNKAFAYTNLKSFDFSGVVTIGNSAFYSSNLRSINIGNTVNSIGKQAFARTELLEYIFIPLNVVNINASAFYDTIEEKFIYCESSIQPEGWSSFWTGINLSTGAFDTANGCYDGNKHTVYWGATYDQYQEALNNQ